MKLSRRQLVRAGFVVPVGVATEASAREGRRVVFVRLRGGADALSLVVPYRNDEYNRARPTTRVTPLPLDGEYGLHPSLRALLPLFERGELGAVVGAGFSERFALHGEAGAALDRAIHAANGAPSPIIELDGWDTHAAQAERLTPLLGELSEKLLAVRAALAEHWARSAIVVVSEFGRSLRETLLGGTDDGHAQTVFVLSGARNQGGSAECSRWTSTASFPPPSSAACLPRSPRARGADAASPVAPRFRRAALELPERAQLRRHRRRVRPRPAPGSRLDAPRAQLQRRLPLASDRHDDTDSERGSVAWQLRQTLLRLQKYEGGSRAPSRATSQSSSGSKPCLVAPLRTLATAKPSCFTPPPQEQSPRSYSVSGSTW